MAIELLVRCFDPRMPVRGTEQLILMRLCEIARHNGDRVVIGLEKLAADCHLGTDRQVRTHVRTLEAKGLVRCDQRAGPNHSNVYWVTLPDLGAFAAPAVFHAEPTPEAGFRSCDDAQRKPASGVDSDVTGSRLPHEPEVSCSHTGRNASAHRNPASAIPVSVSPPPPRASTSDGPEHRALVVAAWVGGGGWTSFRGEDLTGAIVAAVGDHCPEQVVANLERWRRPSGERIHLPPDYQRIRERMERKAELRAAPVPAPAPPERRPDPLALAAAEEARRQLQRERIAAVAELGALWLRVRDGAAIDEAQRRLWVDSPKVWPRRLEGARLVLVSPTALFADTLRKRFTAPLAVALAAELGLPEAEVTVELAREAAMAENAA